MNVRAKFQVQSVEQTVAGSFIKMTPVTGTSEENKSFFKWTPSGELRMGVVSPEVAAAFKPGVEFYVDFSPAT